MTILVEGGDFSAACVQNICRELVKGKTRYVEMVNYMLEQYEQLRSKLPSALATHFAAMKLSVKTTMQCLTFLFYKKLLNVSKLAEKIALSVLDFYLKEEDFWKALA